MSNTAIQLKKSGATGNTPVDLHLGEVAINYADGKLYYKDDVNSIRYITNQDTFGTISSNGELVLALSPTDVLTINPGHGQSILPNTATRTLTFAVDEDQITSFVRKTGDTMTGDLSLPTANLDANYLIVETTLYSGLATRSSTPLPNLVAQFTSNSSGYIQVNQQNINQHGSADYIITADVGSDTDFYIDMGMMGSQYEPGAYNNLGTASNPLDGYLVVQGSTIGQTGGNLVIGTITTGTSGLNTKIVAGGSDAANIVAEFSEHNVKFNRDIIVDGAIISPTINVINSVVSNTQSNVSTLQTEVTNLQSEVQIVFDAANSAGGNAFTTLSTNGYPDVVANSRTSQLTFVAQTGIAIGLNPENSTISIATNTFGASNLAVDFGGLGTIGSVTFDYGYVS